MQRRPIAGRHGLRLRLRRYLIAFDPLTFVLDQRKHPWQMPSRLSVFRKSLNFTSSCEIRLPPVVPVDHYRVPLSATKSGRGPIALSHATLFTDPRICFKHSILLKATFRPAGNRSPAGQMWE